MQKLHTSTIALYGLRARACLSLNPATVEKPRSRVSRCLYSAASRVQRAAACARALAPPLCFTHLTILYSRHFEFDVLVDDATKSARNAALRSELTLFVEDHMVASGRCAQFNSVLVRSGKSCNSLSLNRCSHMSHKSHTRTLHLLTHIQD